MRTMLTCIHYLCVFTKIGHLVYKLELSLLFFWMDFLLFKFFMENYKYTTVEEYEPHMPIINI